MERGHSLATEAWGPDSVIGHLLTYMLVVLPLGWLAIKAMFSKAPVLHQRVSGPVSAPSSLGEARL